MLIILIFGCHADACRYPLLVVVVRVVVVRVVVVLSELRLRRLTGIS